MHNMIFVVEDIVIRNILSRELTVKTVPDNIPEGSMIIFVDSDNVAVRRLGRGVIVLASRFSDVKTRNAICELKLHKNVLKTVIATGSVLEGKPVLNLDGLNICCDLDGLIVCCCKVLVTSLLVNKDLVLRELKLLYDQLSPHLHLASKRELEEVIRALREVIITERKKHRLSKTLTLLTELAVGKTDVLDKIPAHVLDILTDAGIVDVNSKSVDVNTLRLILKKLEKVIYTK